MKKKALLSVSDKTGIDLLARYLTSAGYEILATGKTFSVLKEGGIDVREVSSYTGFPEIFGGRVKTLNPLVMGGILYRRKNEGDLQQAIKHNIDDLDVVCVNLYPFGKVAENPDAPVDELIENIDIGGPSLIRAAAKNHESVTVLTSPEQYEEFIEKHTSGSIEADYRQMLAVRAFEYTANYDVLISNTLAVRLKTGKRYFSSSLEIAETLRYGENPHQSAFLAGKFSDYFEKIHGKELSYNNILDINSAFEIVKEFHEPACVIVKHNNPAGAAIAIDVHNAYILALECDSVAAFGGIVAVNREVDEEFALKLNEIFLEVICAPAFSAGALSILHKKKDRRLVIIRTLDYSEKMSVRSVAGGYLVQNSDESIEDFSALKTVTKVQPTPEQTEDFKFSWIIAKYSKSNAIVFVKDKRTLGIGAGQVSRVDAVKVAVMKAAQAGLSLAGSVVASDAFFPFPDGLLECERAGATAFIQPGGSVRDDEVIKAADDHNVSMVFTGKRHFKH